MDDFHACDVQRACLYTLARIFVRPAGGGELCQREVGHQGPGRYHHQQAGRPGNHYCHRILLHL